MSAGPPVANFDSPLLLMASINCLLYFSGCGCLRMVLAQMTLLTMPRSVSPDAVSLPSQIAGMNRGSSFGRSLCVGSWYCTVSPNSQSGDWCFLFHLRKKLVLPSECTAYLLSKCTLCRTNHGMIGCWLVILML